jgi:hypothetical protein
MDFDVHIEKYAVQRGILKHEVNQYLNIEELSTHLTENVQHHHYQHGLILFQEIISLFFVTIL